MPGSSASYNANNKSPRGGLSFDFDLWAGQGSSHPKGIHASLFLLSSAPGQPFVNLDVSMFNVTSNTLNSSVFGPISLYAAYQTHFAGGYPDTSFGSTGTVIPDPATLLLLGSGLIGVAAIARRKFTKQ